MALRVAALMVAVGLLGWACAEPPVEDELPGLRHWLEQQEGDRPRLSEVSRSAPTAGRAVRSGSGQGGDFPTREVSRQIERAERASAGHASAGRADAALINDAAVGLWARYRHQGEAHDGFRALDFAGRLPPEPIYLWNRALISEGLGLYHRAEVALRALVDGGEAVDGEVSGDLQHDAERCLAELPTAVPAVTWSEVVRQWRAGTLEADIGDHFAARRAVARLALGEWVEEPSSATGAEALAIYTAVSQGTAGDASRAELGRLLSELPPIRLQEVAATIALWLDLEEAVAEWKVDDMRDLLDEVRPRATRFALPLDGWLSYYEALEDYFLGLHGETRSRLASLELEPGDGRLRLLALRLRALAERDLSNLGAAERIFGAAVVEAARLGDAETLANQEASLAILLGEHLRRPTPAWQALAAAFDAPLAEFSAKGRFRVLEAAERVVAASGFDHAAVELQREAVAVAEESQDILLTQDGYADLVRALERIGDDAELVLAEARLRLAENEVTDPAMVAWLELQRLGLEVRRAGSAQQEIELRGDRMQWLRELEMDDEATTEEVDLAWAYLASGDVDRADEHLGAAEAAFEARAAELRGPWETARWAGRYRRLFEGRVRLALEAGRPGLAFEHSEAWRGRVLLGGDRSSAVELPARTAVLSFAWHGTGDDRRLQSWWLDGGALGSREVVRGAAADELVRTIDELLESLRRRQAEAEVTLPALERLHGTLLAPWLEEVDLAAFDRLVVVPDGELFRIPFAALLDGSSGRFLIEDVALAASPSARVYSQLQARADRRPRVFQRALVLGYGGSDDHPLGRLEFAEAEARAVAEIHGAAALLGKAANLAALLDGAPQADLLHISSHGVASRNMASSSHLWLASDEVPSGGEAVSVMTFVESLPPDIGVVVLSACETGVGEASAGEGPLSLAWPFLARGSHSVVSSLWQVDDEETLQLMQTFHRELVAGALPAAALRAAQLETLERMRDLSGDPWVKLWAAFQVQGSG